MGRVGSLRHMAEPCPPSQHSRASTFGARVPAEPAAGRPGRVTATRAVRPAKRRAPWPWSAATARACARSRAARHLAGCRPRHRRADPPARSGARQGAAAIEPAQRRDGFGLLLIGLALLTAAGTWWHLAGPVGASVRGGRRGAFGSLAWTIPFLLCAWAWRVLRHPDRNAPAGRMVIGWGVDPARRPRRGARRARHAAAGRRRGDACRRWLVRLDLVARRSSPASRRTSPSRCSCCWSASGCWCSPRRRCTPCRNGSARWRRGCSAARWRSCPTRPTCST